MAVKFLYYFVFAFVGIMVFLLYQKPYTVVLDTSTQKKADIEMLKIVNYAITSSGISRIIKSDRVLRYKDHDEFYNIDSIRKQKKNYFETLLANSGRFEQNLVNLYGNIRYNNSNGVKFQSEEAQYDLQTKVFKTDVDFVLQDNRTITHGTSLTYQTKDGKIYAKNIKSIIEEKNK